MKNDCRWNKTKEIRNHNKPATTNQTIDQMKTRSHYQFQFGANLAEEQKKNKIPSEKEIERKTTVYHTD